MTISNHLQEWYGLPAFDFPDSEAQATSGTALPAPEDVAWRISVDSYESEEEWEEAFARFAATVDTARVRALIVGSWSDAYDSGPGEVISALLGAKEKLPRLRGLFVGDITFEECEISWINQGEVTRLLDGFPQLEHFGVRGGQDLVFPAVKHERLETLVVESGGLDVAVVRGIAASDLPALENLDLWLGTSWYGANADVSDLEPFLSGTRLPRLRYLALRNSEIQDEIAVALAGAPVVARLEMLDLSMGTLGDDGAEALLNGQPLTHLKKLDLHHHFMSGAMVQRLSDALVPAGVELDVSGSEGNGSGDREGRYTAVAE
ncbi:leucine-rich repeat domain-containing protein [Streptomyces sp. Tu 2975]|uniref:STM4015 family protein n=1 Tax=Streptomyces sp. Tu 2975 TaxID=2676871 RepID=UPI00135B4C8D|nr:STM4015 family protein [Streptomyces sp. Tu 2975]QIP83477.1 leucine-rich repeat domain-containing protein [Streptomyces sp. Tu 2975]